MGSKPRHESRPSPTGAVVGKHEELAARLAARGDKFSHLLGRIFNDELVGGELRSTSALSKSEHAELLALAPEAHAAFQEEIAEITSRLRELLGMGDPFYSLGLIHLRNVSAPWGGYYEPTHSGFENKVELVAGLLLTQPVATDADALGDAEMQELHDELDRLMDLLLLRNLTAPPGDDAGLAELRFTAALQWTFLRGTSYAHHGRELAQEVFGPFDDWCLKTYGFTTVDVIRLGQAVEALWRRKVNQLFDAARQFGLQVREELRAAKRRRSLAPAALARLGSAESVELLMQRAFIEVIKRGVVDAVSLTPEELAHEGIPPETVEALLTEFSISLGSQPAEVYTGVFDPSPLVEHPLVEHLGRYVLPIPGALLRDTLKLLEDRFVRGRPGFPKARARTLDALAVRYLCDLLPGAVGETSLFYEGAELDGLVLFEDVALLIEGKASDLSVQARRGDLARLERDIGRAVEEAWVQGARARDYLLSDGVSTFTDERGNEILRVDPATINEVWVVNPTLHELAGHAVQLPRLRRLGLFPDAEYPWSVYINDLRVIAETCDNPAVFLHYLTWRNRLPFGEQLAATDELDVWGSFLLGERFGRLNEVDHFMLGSHTTDFDAYYAGLLGEGPPAPKPSHLLQEPLLSFVDRMAQERPSGWRHAAGVCLDLSIPERAAVCAKARETWREANRGGDLAVLEFGRVHLIGVPRGMPLEVALLEAVAAPGDPTFRIFVRGSKAQRGEVAWAEQIKPVSFELSAFEEAVARMRRTQSG